MAFRLNFNKVLVKDNTNRTTKAESDILQQANQIALRVTVDTFNALEGRVSNAESTIVQNANQIALRVTQNTFNTLAGRVSSAESSITQQAGQIASKVSTTDYTGTKIASLINQTASTVKIQASHIQLEGIVTANTNFKVLADGSIEAVNAKLSGSITATRMVSPPGIRTDGTTYDGTDYYGEVGVSDGNVGLGLYDKRFDAGPYMRILELGSATGFTLVDTNNIRRFSAQSGETNITDALGNVGFRILNASRFILSPNGNNYIVVTNDTIQIVKDGVVKASW